MATHDSDLVSLNELRLVLRQHAGPDQPRARSAPRGSRRLPTLLAVAGVFGLVSAGVAIADGLGAFSGISAAQHPQAAADVIDAATAAYMKGQDCNHAPGEPGPHCMPSIANVLLNTARRVGQLPSGQNVYVVTTTSSNLCFVVGPPYPEWACQKPLSQLNPTTVFIYGNNPDVPHTTFGVALDGVTTVSFQAEGQEVTVPVDNNVWTYQGTNNAFFSLTARFQDGTTVLETH